MEISIKSGNPEKQRCGCVVVALFEAKRLSTAAKALDQASDGYLGKLLRRGDIEGKSGESLMLHHLPGVNAERVLLIGCGKEKAFSEATFRNITVTAAKQLEQSGATDAVSYLPELEIEGRDIGWKISQSIISAENALYRFDQLKSDTVARKRPLRKLHLATIDHQSAPTCNKAMAQGEAIAAGMSLTRDLSNLPGNICTPTYLANQANKLGRKYPKMKCKSLSEAQMAKFGMGALLSVSKGSREPAKLVVMDYQGGKKGSKPIVLIGKGLTFDAGGISIKPSAAMDEMKYDMCGGASIFGTMQAIAQMKLPINVIGVVPSSENLPDGAANKPGDIVTSMSGQTIEILNTDAEGRLILCDALTYSERFNPKAVIDVATLTGACVIALGQHASGLLGNHEPLIDELLDAGKQVGDRAWQMPLWDEYQEQIKSPFADMANIGGREAGTITAACFLSRFTKKFHWAHLDIAGAAWKSGAEKGATGRPVTLLTQYLIDRAG
ncbi:leucyl aminopeptidase [Solemya pervernicosa gill symbiont]|uniref:Probable cytosol aminopeptidase n=2 Tax=Gammaproteobacteria incertae sedis TaxID=118884 RepID=A0A1T2L650_9GAMM|nr:leucyl aminopeptidase [Candidatus Reidiella endopervernicosa]OOZ40534.1 leucyl aminopeptidase [Solemya pervernicosa gill symbiont]QKQ27521.1 leucyl aminopeptidase [Candidatus Reidiella endopervernicosa]